MSRSNFNGRCPHCSVVLHDLRGKWESSDYSNVFFVECQNCQKQAEIQVHQTPEFEASKPMCQWCKLVEVGGSTYCKSCLKKLNDLSEHNRQRAESSK